jgi:hypothetical protein
VFWIKLTRVWKEVGEFRKINAIRFVRHDERKWVIPRWILMAFLKTTDITWQYINICKPLTLSFYGEGPRSRCYGRTAAFRLIVQPCDKDY